MRSSFILATTAIILAACGGDGATDDSATNSTSESTGGQVVNYTAPTELATLDTTLMTDINSSNYISHAIEGLLKIDADGKPVPAIAAEAGTVSEDGLTYTYKLRDDAVWSNGEPVTANDFVFAWQRLVDPEAGASYAYLAETIKNANEIMAGEMDPEKLGVTAVSDTEITIELTQPTPYFESLLAFSAFFPQNEAFV
ncbi:MAG TPA: peptide ABC transporter substrate-binding protein, partial [Trichococcus sp.]|nr:peptide ABC transporter substrate-binding protein [Trichococcus sp.]